MYILYIILAMLGISYTCFIIYELIRSDKDVVNAYNKVTGHKLNNQNTIKHQVIVGAIPQVESIFKEATKYHDQSLDIILTFGHNSMSLFFYNEGVKPSLIKVPYSNIKQYYYKLVQDYHYQEKYGNDAINIYIKLKQGSIVIVNEDLISSNIPNILHILERKTTPEQQVKPMCDRQTLRELSSDELIEDVQELPQHLSDKQQRNKIHHKIIQDEKGTTKRTHYMQDVY